MTVKFQVGKSYVYDWGSTDVQKVEKCVGVVYDSGQVCYVMRSAEKQQFYLVPGENTVLIEMYSELPSYIVRNGDTKDLLSGTQVVDGLSASQWRKSPFATDAKVFKLVEVDWDDVI